MKTYILLVIFVVQKVNCGAASPFQQLPTIKDETNQLSVESPENGHNGLPRTADRAQDISDSTPGSSFIRMDQHRRNGEQYPQQAAEDDSNLPPTVKKKRCPSPMNHLVGNVFPPPPYSNEYREFVREMIFKRIMQVRCQNCLESPACKVKQICNCTEVCNAAAPTPDPVSVDQRIDDVTSTEAPVVGLMPLEQIINPDASQQVDDPTLVSSRSNVGEEEQGLSANEDRFYTIGAFGEGPMQKLLAKLLHISEKDHVDKLVVLAKSECKFGEAKDIRPVIIDTAHVFTKNGGPPEKIDVELHTVNNTKVDFQFTEELNKELDVAIETKKKMLGDDTLTSDEIDEIINHAMSMFENRNDAPVGSFQREDAGDIVQKSLDVKQPENPTQRAQDDIILGDAADTTPKTHPSVVNKINEKTGEVQISDFEMGIIDSIYSNNPEDQVEKQKLIEKIKEEIKTNLTASMRSASADDSPASTAHGVNADNITSEEVAILDKIFKENTTADVNQKKNFIDKIVQERQNKKLLDGTLKDDSSLQKIKTSLDFNGFIEVLKGVLTPNIGRYFKVDDDFKRKTDSLDGWKSIWAHSWNNLSENDKKGVITYNPPENEEIGYQNDQMHPNEYDDILNYQQILSFLHNLNKEKRTQVQDYLLFSDPYKIPYGDEPKSDNNQEIITSNLQTNDSTLDHINTTLTFNEFIDILKNTISPNIGTYLKFDDNFKKDVTSAETWKEIWMNSWSKLSDEDKENVITYDPLKDKAAGYQSQQAFPNEQDTLGYSEIILFLSSINQQNRTEIQDFLQFTNPFTLPYRDQPENNNEEILKATSAKDNNIFDDTKETVLTFDGFIEILKDSISPSVESYVKVDDNFKKRMDSGKVWKKLWMKSWGKLTDEEKKNLIAHNPSKNTEAGVQSDQSQSSELDYLNFHAILKFLTSLNLPTQREVQRYWDATNSISKMQVSGDDPTKSGIVGQKKMSLSLSMTLQEFSKLVEDTFLREIRKQPPEPSGSLDLKPEKPLSDQPYSEKAAADYWIHVWNRSWAKLNDAQRQQVLDWNPTKDHVPPSEEESQQNLEQFSEGRIISFGDILKFIAYLDDDSRNRIQDFLKINKGGIPINSSSTDEIKQNPALRTSSRSQIEENAPSRTPLVVQPKFLQSLEESDVLARQNSADPENQFDIAGLTSEEEYDVFDEDENSETSPLAQIKNRFSDVDQSGVLNLAQRGTVSAPLLQQKALSNNKEIEILSQNTLKDDKVGCSHEDDDEYARQANVQNENVRETQLPNARFNSEGVSSNSKEVDEKVGCSKEEDDDYYARAANSESGKLNAEELSKEALAWKSTERTQTPPSETSQTIRDATDEQVGCEKDKDKKYKDDYEPLYVEPHYNYGGYRSAEDITKDLGRSLIKVRDHLYSSFLKLNEEQKEMIKNWDPTKPLGKQSDQEKNETPDYVNDGPNVKPQKYMTFDDIIRTLDSMDLDKRNRIITFLLNKSVSQPESSTAINDPYVQMTELDPPNVKARNKAEFPDDEKTPTIFPDSHPKLIINPNYPNTPNLTQSAPENLSSQGVISALKSSNDETIPSLFPTVHPKLISNQNYPKAPQITELIDNIFPYLFPSEHPLMTFNNNYSNVLNFKKNGGNQATPPSTSDAVLEAKLDWQLNSREELPTKPPKAVENYKNLGKLVSGGGNANQNLKNTNMFFVGNGIKLPLTIKQSGDGSYYLSVDIEKLCNCEKGHCRTELTRSALDEVNNVNQELQNPKTLEKLEKMELLALPVVNKKGEVPINKAPGISKRSIKKVKTTSGEIVTTPKDARNDGVSDEENDITYNININEENDGADLYKKLKFLNKMGAATDNNKIALDEGNIAENVYVKQKINLFKNVLNWWKNLTTDRV